jgi:hypothetical protein
VLTSVDTSRPDEWQDFVQLGLHTELGCCLLAPVQLYNRVIVASDLVCTLDDHLLSTPYA